MVKKKLEHRLTVCSHCQHSFSTRSKSNWIKCPQCKKKFKEPTIYDNDKGPQGASTDPVNDISKEIDKELEDPTDNEDPEDQVEDNDPIPDDHSDLLPKVSIMDEKSGNPDLELPEMDVKEPAYHSKGQSDLNTIEKELKKYNEAVNTVHKNVKSGKSKIVSKDRFIKIAVRMNDKLRARKGLVRLYALPPEMEYIFGDEYEFLLDVYPQALVYMEAVKFIKHLFLILELGDFYTTQTIVIMKELEKKEKQKDKDHDKIDPHLNEDLVNHDLTVPDQGLVTHDDNAPLPKDDPENA